MLWICRECPDEVGCGCVRFAQLPPKKCICGPHIGIPIFRGLDVDEEDLKDELKDRGFCFMHKKTATEAMKKFVDATEMLNSAVEGYSGE